MMSMRITVTLDDDVENLLRNAVRERGESCKEVLNNAIRDGLRGPSSRTAIADSFAQPRGVAFAWTALLAFLRLSTRAGLFERPLTIEQALQAAD